MLRRTAALAGLPLLAGISAAQLPAGSTLTEGDVRVQALSPTLVRLEVRGPKGFEDRTTFRIMRRNWSGVPGAAVVRRGDPNAQLVTKDWTVAVPTGAKDLSGVRIVDASGTTLYTPSGKETARTWIPAPGATSRSWAFADAPRIVPAPWGATPAPNDDPNSGWDMDNDARDVYVFLPNRSYPQLRADFLKLTGPTEMPPLFMLGLIDSKYYPYTDREALDRVDQYRKRSIPLDVLTIDTDWRLNGSHGYTSDPRYFPDMQGFIRKAKAKGVRLMYNDHPEPQAQNALDPKEINYRWNGLTKLMNEGMDVWWYDRNWNVGLNEPAPGIRGHLWGMRVYHDVTERLRPNERPVIMANTDGIDNGIRNSAPDVAAHRFSVQWTGDTSATWGFLRRAVENAVQGGVEGLNPWINDDLGGHNMGQPSPELYVRFMQYGSLCPVMRPHCTRDLERAPWAFGPEAERITGDYVRMRYRLLPLLYASARESYDLGEPIVRRLDLDFPDHKEAARDDQFLLGKSLLVAPVVDGGPKSLPKEWAKDGWTAEYFDGEELKGEPLLRRQEATPGFALTRNEVAPGVPKDHFSARWNGTVTNRTQSVARLIASSDDGVRVYVDDKLVLDRWGPADSAVNTIPFEFKPGASHRVKIEYMEIDGGAMMQLRLDLGTDRTSSRSLWVPPGTWTDLWSGARLTGPKMATVSVPLGQSPMFARLGAIVPTLPQTQRTSEGPWSNVRLEAWAGANGATTLYEDDGHSVGYRKDAFRRTAIAMSSDAKRTTVTISPAKGTYPGAIASRSYTVRLHVPAGRTATGVTIGGKPVKWTRLAKSAKPAMPFLPGAARDGDVIEVAVPSTSVAKSVVVAIATR